MTVAVIVVVIIFAATFADRGWALLVMLGVAALTVVVEEFVRVNIRYWFRRA
nr:hypothetical protein [Micromonospora provocatoris]